MFYRLLYTFYKRIYTNLLNTPDLNSKFILFGHIHSTQKVKKIQIGDILLSGLNVGVDCHFFNPINLNDIEFYHNACLLHYDSDVF